MRNMICTLLAALFAAGCSTVTTSLGDNAQDNAVLQQGSMIVKAIIDENFRKFSEGANEVITENSDADSFLASCKQLQETYGKAGTFRYLGELQTPLLVNQLFAVRFSKKGADGKTVEHEQLLQLIFGRENNGSYKLLGMRFM